MSLHGSAGLTLLELMIAIATVSILASMSVPILSTMIETNAAETLLSDLARTMSMARASAVFKGRMVTLCRSADSKGCNGEWHSGMLVFVDQDNDRVVDTGDEILHITPGSRLPGTLILRSFPSRQYLQFAPTGFISSQSGNFTWCPPDNDARQAQQLIFNITGRVRLALDADGDGIRDDANGKPLTCG